MTRTTRVVQIWARRADRRAVDRVADGTCIIKYAPEPLGLESLPRVESQPQRSGHLRGDDGHDVAGFANG